MSWQETGRPWVAPSPNIPTPWTAIVYPGGCLLEATSVSEGRGTTRPFELFGSPTIEPVALADRLNGAGLPGSTFVPTFFKPQFHKHAGEVCGGVQWVVDDPVAVAPYAAGVEIVRALAESTSARKRQTGRLLVCGKISQTILPQNIAKKQSVLLCAHCM